MKWKRPLTEGDLFVGLAIVLASVCVFSIAWITAPARSSAPAPEKYLCLTYTDEYVLTTEYQLSQPGQMLFGNYLETKDRVVVSKADIKVCGLTRQ